jgi:hypothetical protein
MVVVVVAAVLVVLVLVLVVMVVVVVVKVPAKWKRAVLILATVMAKCFMVVVEGWGGMVEVRKVGTGGVRCISLWTITQYRVVICTVDTLKLV